MNNTSAGISRRHLLVGAAGITAASLPIARAARAQQVGLDRVNIISAAGNLTAIFEELMNQQSLFEKFKLTTKPVYVSDGAKLLGSLLNGDMDLCPLAGFANIFPAVQRGAKVKLINGGVVLGQQTVVSANPDIKSVKDLEGKTIGVGSLGAQLHQTMVALLLKKGVDPSTVTFANIGGSADVLRAVVAKTVDAGPSQIDVIPNAAKMGIHQLEGGNMWSDLPEYPFQGGFTSEQMITGKRDILVRTLAAYGSLFRFLTGPDSRDAFLAARRKALSGSGDEFDQASDFQWQFFQKVKPFALDLELSQERIAYIQDLNVRLGVQTEALAYDKVADMSLAKDAMKLIRA
jgi:ABC-type nitrate/sulfonate/bicarbonate transport system substrate-binding protein